MEFFWHDVTIWHRRFNYPILESTDCIYCGFNLSKLLKLLILMHWNWSKPVCVVVVFVHCSPNALKWLKSYSFNLVAIKNAHCTMDACTSNWSHIDWINMIESMWRLIEQASKIKDGEATVERSKQRWCSNRRFYKGDRPLKQTKRKGILVSFRSIEIRLYQAELLNSISLNSTLLFNIEVIHLALRSVQTPETEIVYAREHERSHNNEFRAKYL